MKRFHLFCGTVSSSSGNLGWFSYEGSHESIDAAILYYNTIDRATEWAHIIETLEDGSLDLAARLISGEWAIYGEFIESIIPPYK